VSTGGYGVSIIDIEKDSPLIDKTLLGSGLRKDGVLVLVIERKGNALASPEADTRIRVSDTLVCFGRLEDIRKKISGFKE